MPKLILFDVDGTLAESGETLDDDMKALLERSHAAGFTLGIVGGGKLEKILLQLDGIACIDHYFTECGCVYHKKTGMDLSKDLVQVYRQNIRAHKLYDYINILIKRALYFLSQVDYTLTGNFIDLRSGIIYISLIGMSATSNERELFFELDAKHQYRQRLLCYLENEAHKQQIDDKITICEGGRAGIAIYPTEYDKIQVLAHLHDHNYDDIHFFGDKYLRGGNDHALMNAIDVIGHPVDSINNTKTILAKILEYSN